MKKIVREMAWFVAVGSAAALTHWAVAVACVRAGGMPPLIANVLGWLVAFLVSFSGHFHFTFHHHAKALLKSLRRFFLISASGFLINEAAYAYLLHATDLPFDLLLAVILVAIAVLTFVFSRLWAFRHKAAAA